MKILLSVRGLRAREGGPTYSVPALARALSIRGHNVSILVDAYDIAPLEGVCLVRTNELPGTLTEYVRDFDIVHDNGVWLPFNHAIAKATDDAGVPRVISPRGGLQPWVLRQRRWKKWIGWFLYQKSDLMNAKAVIGTALIETKEVKALGYAGSIYVIPNGSDITRPVNSPDRPIFPRRALFLSRLHSKKGIHDLVMAWIRIKPKGWALDIVGPDEARIVSQSVRLLAREGLAEEVVFHGPKFGEEKLQFYNQASLFILPTYSENFGNSIVEAMLMGVPVLTTTETPWSMLDKEGIGWVVKPGVDSLEAKLRHVLQLDIDELAGVGQRANVWCADRFTWDAVAAQVENAYKEILLNGN